MAGDTRELHKICGRIEVARHLTVDTADACADAVVDPDLAEYLAHAADALRLAIDAVEARLGPAA